MTVQLLRAHGCRVLGLDLDPSKLELAQRFRRGGRGPRGREDPVAAAQAFSRGRGVDAVIITAATTQQRAGCAGGADVPQTRPHRPCRRHRARAVARRLLREGAHVPGFLLLRPGPLRPGLRGAGDDYPLGYVRWTEQRNFEAVLDMLADGRLDVLPPDLASLPASTTPCAPIDVIDGSEPSLGILLEYPGHAPPERARSVARGQPLPAR